MGRDTRAGSGGSPCREPLVVADGIGHSGAAIAIAVAGGDWRAADESAAIALRIFDPRPEP